MLKTRSVAIEIFLRTLLVMGGIAASLLIAEGLLRLANYSYRPLKIEVMHKSDWRPMHAFRDRHFVYDPTLIWRPKLGSSPFNAQGYRGREVTLAKGADEFRILAVGDSNTLGWDGPSGPNWPGYLQQLFDETTANATVVNAGVYGYTAFQGLERFEQALSIKPDMALISFGANDAHLVTVSDSDFVNRPVRRSIDYVLAHTKVGQVVHAAVDKFTSNRGESLVRRVSLADYSRCLEQMASLGERHGIQIVFLTRPFIGESPNPWWWKNAAPQYNAATIDVGKRNGVLVIDVYSYFENHPEYFADESHFSEAGHRRMAKFIYEQIRPRLVVR
jgi:lysophospholipase L1-like esterase